MSVRRRMTFVMDHLYAPGTRSGAELVKETMNEACRQKEKGWNLPEKCSP